MRAWIVTVGEPLPFPDATDRLHRSGILAQFLLARGHEVVWWGSTFDHFTKKHHYAEDTSLAPAERFKMVLFHGDGYSKNVSFARLKDHRQVGKKFAEAIEAESNKPNIIICSFPTIELSVEAVRYGKKYGVPVIVDVRDLWPDIFVEIAPKPLRPLAKLPLHSLYRKTSEALEGCTGLIGISKRYKEWGLGYAKRAARESDGLFPLGYRKIHGKGEDLDRAKTTLTARGVNPALKICWFVGTFGRTYDLEPVIKAARRLQDQGIDDIQFVLSGSGDNQKTYEAMAAGLENLVFTGWVNASEIAYLMSITKIGLAAYAPSAPQGLPNKFFEYLSSGIPILSSLGDEAAELLEERRCGRNYRAGDETDLEMKIREMLAAPAELTSMGLRGKKLFDEELSADVIYPQIVDFLERVAKSNAKRNPPASSESVAQL